MPMTFFVNKFQLDDLFAKMTAKIYIYIYRFKKLTKNKNLYDIMCIYVLKTRLPSNLLHLFLPYIFIYVSFFPSSLSLPPPFSLPLTSSIKTPICLLYNLKILANILSSILLFIALCYFIIYKHIFWNLTIIDNFINFTK